MGAERYQQLLRERQVRRLLAGVTVAGFSTAMTLALVLAVQNHHSIGAAGLVAAAYAIGDGVFIPARGRLIDRLGHRVLMPLVAGHALFVCLLAVGAASLSVGALALLAALAGAFRAPLFASLRSLWADLTDGPEELDAAYAMHAVFNEVLWISGPVLVAAVATLVSPAAGLAALAVLQVAGTAVFASTPVSRAWRSGPRRAGRLGALASPGVVTLTAANVGAGFLFSGLDVACVAFGRSEGSAGLGGLGLAALAVGSAAGGIAYGLINWRGSLEHRYLGLCVVMLAAVLPIGLAWSIPSLIALMALAGLAVAPWTAVEMSMIDRVAPSGTDTEATTWLIAAVGAGGAAGAAVAGQVAQHWGAGWALEVAAAGALVAVLASLIGFRTLAPPVPAAGQALSLRQM